MLAADGAGGYESDDKDGEMSGAVAVDLLFAENIGVCLKMVSTPTPNG